jgi:hypothetical protein
MDLQLTSHFDLAISSNNSSHDLVWAGSIATKSRAATPGDLSPSNSLAEIEIGKMKLNNSDLLAESSRSERSTNSS